MGEPLIASFVVRIVQAGEAEQAADQAPWRVTVRHVQTGDERQFTNLDDALAFMHHFMAELQHA